MSGGETIVDIVGSAENWRSLRGDGERITE